MNPSLGNPQLISETEVAHFWWSHIITFEVKGSRDTARFPELTALTQEMFSRWLFLIIYVISHLQSSCCQYTVSLLWSKFSTSTAWLCGCKYSFKPLTCTALKQSISAAVVWQRFCTSVCLGSSLALRRLPLSSTQLSSMLSSSVTPTRALRRRSSKHSSSSGRPVLRISAAFSLLRHTFMRMTKPSTEELLHTWSKADFEFTLLPQAVSEPQYICVINVSN